MCVVCLFLLVEVAIHHAFSVLQYSDAFVISLPSGKAMVIHILHTRASCFGLKIMTHRMNSAFQSSINAYYKCEMFGSTINKHWCFLFYMCTLQGRFACSREDFHCSKVDKISTLAWTWYQTFQCWEGMFCCLKSTRRSSFQKLSLLFSDVISIDGSSMGPIRWNVFLF